MNARSCAVLLSRWLKWLKRVDADKYHSIASWSAICPESPPGGVPQAPRGTQPCPLSELEPRALLALQAAALGRW